MVDSLIGVGLHVAPRGLGSEVDGTGLGPGLKPDGLSGRVGDAVAGEREPGAGDTVLGLGVGLPGGDAALGVAVGASVMAVGAVAYARSTHRVSWKPQSKHTCPSYWRRGLPAVESALG